MICPLCNKNKIRNSKNLRCWDCYVRETRSYDPLKRIMVHVSKTKECWLWTAFKDRDGYGKTLLFHNGKRIQRAHRAIFSLVNGPIPEGMWLLHKCDNPSCVNPKHLYLGTVIENAKDKSLRMRIHGKKNPNYRHGKMCQFPTKA